MGLENACDQPMMMRRAVILFIFTCHFHGVVECTGNGDILSARLTCLCAIVSWVGTNLGLTQSTASQSVSQAVSQHFELLSLLCTIRERNHGFVSNQWVIGLLVLLLGNRHMCGSIPMLFARRRVGMGLRGNHILG